MTRPRITGLRFCAGLPGYPCHRRYRHSSPWVSRCPDCELAHQRARNQRRPEYAGSWAARSRAARRAEPWCHCTLAGHGHDGATCMTSTDLTLDHEHGRVECRRCNSGHRRDTS